MKNTLMCCAVLVVSLGTANLGSGRPVAPPAKAVSPVTQALNQFGLDLYGQLKKEQPGKNLFFSPASVSVALAMTAAGARGQTEAEIADSLHLSGILPQAHVSNREALDRWNATAVDRGYTLRVANRLWGQQSFSFRPEYLTLTERQYGAELGRMDFLGQPDNARRQINAWVERQTNQTIRDLLPAGTIDGSTRLVLTNAIYFKGDWAIPFRKGQTLTANFTVSPEQRVSALFMQQTRNYSFAENASLQILELPYRGNGVAMLVLLPKAESGLADLEESLSASKIAELRAMLRSRQVEVHLPKFKLEAAQSMKSALEGLGMKLPFTKAADFSGMVEERNLHLSDVIHKAFVVVNEEGTEAAAATGVVARVHAAAHVARPVVFRADHPFVFAICDQRDGSILFLGRLSDPKTERP